MHTGTIHLSNVSQLLLALYAWKRMEFLFWINQALLLAIQQSKREKPNLAVLFHISCVHAVVSLPFIVLDVFELFSLNEYATVCGNNK